MEWLNVRGRLTSGRPYSFLALLTGLLVSLFAGIFITSTSVLAADAVWQNGGFTKDNKTYTEVTDAATLKAMNFATGAKVYATNYSNSYKNTQTVDTITIARGVNPAQATDATASSFRYTPPATWYRDDSSQIKIATAQNSQTTGDNSTGDSGQGQTDDDEGATTCQIKGIGWLVCYPSTFIAEGVEMIYGLIEDFLTVRELETSNTSSTLYIAWNTMRGFANAAFIIAFMIIIYSHITSFGISNYGIKKLASRLIIAALLVNLSYYICAIGVDLSNITGHAIKNMFDSLTSTLAANGVANNEGLLSTASIIQAVLTGGTLVAAGGIAVGGSLLAAAPLVLPTLLAVFIALLVALVVFTVRQALVIILIVIAPLAFVCYLLPGTEKWFDKWRSTFITMLMFFPAFAVVFGGSKLAGMIIVSNPSSIMMVVIGWAVQLAPLALAPLVMKLGGGILNRVAGIVNDPTRGAIDRTRNWSRDKSKQIAHNRTYANDNLRGWNFIRKSARHVDRRGRLMKDRLADAEKRAENSYHDWDRYKQQDLRSRQTGDRGELLSQQASNRYDELKGGAYPTDIKSSWAEQQLRKRPKYNQRAIAKEVGVVSETTKLYESIAVEGIRKNNATRALNRQFAESMLASQDLQKRAASIYEFGEEAAYAGAISNVSADAAKTIDEARRVIDHFNFSPGDRQAHARGESVTLTDSLGRVKTFDQNDKLVQEANIRMQIEFGTVKEARELIEMSGSALERFKGAISESVAKSKLSEKAPFIGGKLIPDIAQSNIKNQADFINFIQDWIGDKKFTTATLAKADPQGLTAILEAAQVGPTQRPGESSSAFGDRAAKFRSGLEELADSSKFAREDAGISPNIQKASKSLLKKLEDRDYTP